MMITQGVIKDLDIQGKLGEGISKSGIKHIIGMSVENVVQSIFPSIKNSRAHIRSVRTINQLIRPPAPDCIERE